MAVLPGDIVVADGGAIGAGLAQAVADNMVGVDVMVDLDTLVGDISVAVVGVVEAQGLMGFDGNVVPVKCDMFI